MKGHHQTCFLILELWYPKLPCISAIGIPEKQFPFNLHFPYLPSRSG